MEHSPAEPASLFGILPVLATPFTSETASVAGPAAADRVSEDEMIRIVDFVIAAGVHGVVFPGVASEFNYLTVAERQRLSALVGERVAGRVPIVVGASAESVADVIALAQTGVDNGASAAMIMPPANLGSTADSIIQFFQRITQATDIPIILQNAPPPVGAGLSVETLTRIVRDIQNIRYIKEETLPSGQRITRLLEATSGHLMGIMGGGGARYVVDEFNRGACAAMPACELADIHVALYRKQQSGEHAQARHIYNRTLPLLLFQAVFRMRMTKEVLQRRGIIDHAGLRAPLPELDDGDIRELETLLLEIDDLFTVTNQ